MPPKQAPNAWASGCVVLFSLPFIGMGSALAYKGYRSLHDPTFKNPWIAVGIGSVFAFVGVLLLVGSFYGTRLQRATRAREQAFAQQPWMWREDWAQGRAEGLGRKSAGLAWFFALVWNGISWTIGYVMWTHADPRRPIWADLMIGLFCAIGVGLLGVAITQTLRRVRFGTTYVALQSLPAPLGGTLKGTIDAHLPPLPHGINLTLTCVNRVTSGTGDSRTTTDKILWQSRNALGPEQIMAGPSGSTIPVSFEVPRDKPASDHADQKNQVLWLLRAEADVPGVNFDERYEVPVFATSASPSLEEWQSKETLFESQHPASAPVRPTVQISTAEGGTLFYFPPGRNLSVSLWLTVFCGIFGAASYFLWHVHAPIIFPLMFSFFTALIALITVSLWFGSARVVVGSSELRLSTSTLGFGGSKSWSANEILKIYPKITMQSGNAAYYTATLALSSSREVSLGNTLRDHEEAEWICEQMRAILRLQAKSTASG